MNIEKPEEIVKTLEMANRFLKDENEQAAHPLLDQLLQLNELDIITWMAITNNYLKIAEQLLKKGANPNIAINNQMISLHTMTVRNNIEGVELLLSFHANPDLALESGETPLWTASRHGFNLVAYKLLLAGANPNLANKDLWTPLMLATYMKNYELALLLLEFKADPNIAKKDDGNTPIFYSLLDNYPELTEQLLKSGARLDIRNLKDQTPEEFVISNEEIKISPNLSKSSLLVEFHKANNPITEKISKFGGQPVWLQEATWPVSKQTGKPMSFICQIKIEKDLFPNAIGEMAYIFMTDDSEDFVDDTYLAEGGENAVIIQRGNIPSFIEVTHSSTGPSLEQEFALSFIPIAEPFQSVNEFNDFIELQPDENKDNYRSII